MQTNNSSGAGVTAWNRPLTELERQASADGRLTYDHHRLVHDLITAGEEWADLDAAANVLEETKGSVLGQMVQAFIQQGKSATAAEHMAKGSAMFIQHVNRMVDARRLALRAKINYEAGQTFIDLARTRESSRRAEMKMAGST